MFDLTSRGFNLISYTIICCFSRPGNSQNFGQKIGVIQGSHSDWKTWKNEKAFSSQEILNRPEKSGKITQNTGKFGEFQTNIVCYFFVIFN